MLLEPNEYVIRFRGVEVGRGQVYANQLMAMPPPPEVASLEGLAATEPVFDLPVTWIKPELREVAEARGYTVIEPGTALATHLHELIKQRAGQLLTRQDVQDIVEVVRQTEPAVVNELIPELASVGEVQQVLRWLLDEQISIRDISVILEALADGLRVTENLQDAAEVVRLALDDAICEQYRDSDNRLHVVTVDPQLEQDIQASVVQTPQGSVCAVEPQLQQVILQRTQEAIQQVIARGHEPVVIPSPRGRRHFRALISRTFPQVGVLSHAEGAPGVEVRAAAQIAA